LSYTRIIKHLARIIQRILQAVLQCLLQFAPPMPLQWLRRQHIPDEYFQPDPVPKP